jgi:signal transduction histidine kinase
MIYLIPVYLIFSLIVTIRQKKDSSLLWFLLMPIGFSLALFGLILFTEYVSFANFIENPLLISSNLFIWKLNYYLDLSIFGMYRLMDIGIALYMLGAVGFPLSQHPRRGLLRRGSFIVAVPALLILVADPGILQHIFEPDSVFQGMQEILSGLNILNRLLNIIVKAALITSLVLSLWIYSKTPKPFRKRSELIILGLVPIHVLVFVLFYWFPSHSIHIWRLSTVKLISLPYTRFTASLIFVLSIFSLGVLIYISIVYNSFALNDQRHQIGVKARMKTAGSGLKIFTHSIKNQFIAVKLLAEQGLVQEAGQQQLQGIHAICEKTIARLNALPVLPDRIALTYSHLTTSSLLGRIEKEYPDIVVRNTVPAAKMVVDEHYFIEVLRNLIINSKEAVRGVEIPYIIMYCSRQLDYLVISVEDNGCGIDRARQKHVFEPFYSTKPSITNWGMGLAFSQQLVESFGGTMRLESMPDIFTKVEIYIPEASDE